MKFTKGDIVVLSNKNTEWGTYGIPAREWGKQFVYYGPGVIRSDTGEWWSIYENMLEPYLTLSPLELQVTKYVKSELYR